jgi:hypothetical protein
MITSAVVKNSWVLTPGSPPSIGAQYAITIPYWSTGDLVVQLIDAGGTKQTLTLGTDYTLTTPSGVPPQTEAGGILTVQSNWTYSPADWATLSVYRAQSVVQQTNFRNGDSFDMPTLETEFDKLVGMIQETNAGTTTGSGGSYFPTGSAATVLQGLAASLLAGQIAFGLLPSGTSSPLAVTWQQLLAGTLGTNIKGLIAADLGSGWVSPLEAALTSGWASAFATAFNTAWSSIIGAAPGSGWAAALAATFIPSPIPPVGFVYFQGPNDATPASMWSTGTWTDVSSEEANMTRRVYGSLAGAWVSGTPAVLTVGVSGGVPTITVTSGGSGYCSGGSGNVPLVIAGTCTTQMAAHGVVTGGVIQSIAVDTAGAGYTNGAVAVYDGVYGHGDLVQGHRHAWISGSSTTMGASTGTAFDSNYNPGNNTGTWVKDPTTDGTNGTPRKGAETAGAYMLVKKWRRTA